MFSESEFPDAARKPPGAPSEPSDSGLQVSHVLVHSNRAQMFESTLANVGIAAGIVGGTPQSTCGGELAGVLRHLSGQDLHHRMSVGDPRALGENLGGFLVVL